MATTIEELAAILEADGLKYRIVDGLIRTGFLTEHYKCADGPIGLPLVIALEEDGEFLKIVAPTVYSYKEGPYKAQLFQTLLLVSYRTKMVQFEYDPADGEVRAIIEFPIEDGTITSRQLLRCVRAIAEIVDQFHESIVAAMTKGELPKHPAEDDEELAQMWRDFQEFLEKKRRAEGASPGEGLPS